MRLASSCCRGLFVAVGGVVWGWWCAPLAAQDLRLPAVLTSHAVFQRQQPVRIYGWAAPLADVFIEATWGPEISGRADGKGDFAVLLPPPDDQGPHTITVRSQLVTYLIEEVLFGEVWVCGGQSNMEWTLGPGVGKGIANWEEEAATAALPRIRLFSVPKVAAAGPQQDCGGRWLICSPETVKTFSAVGFLFGRELHRRLDVPIGLISCNWGGTVAEAWMPRADLQAFGEFDEALATLSDPPEKLGPNVPSVLYNGMLAPITGFGVRGAIFYQGESNVGRPEQYRRLFPALITSWRRAFGRQAMPFYYVQIAPYGYGGKSGALAAFLREAQTATMSVLDDVGMAVTMDIGSPTDIHPLNKQDVADRLSRWALAKTYGQTDVVHSGPLLLRHEIDGNTVRLTFAHADGLKTRDGNAPSHFMVAGADRVFHPADAVIDGTTVVVRNADVGAPVAVRYAFGASDAPNLCNGAGLPAPSFRTDDWPPPQ